MKSNKALIWVIAVVLAAMIVFVYIMVSEAPRTLAKITVSYFVDEQEIAASVSKRLFQETNGQRNYIIGFEPDKSEQLKIVMQLKSEFEKTGPFAKVFVDEELALSKEALASLKATDIAPFKEDIYKIGEKLQALEKDGVSYLVISANIYTSSLLKKNPIAVLRENFKIMPLVFSIGYLPVSAADEKHVQFACNTEDRNGTSDWGCVVINKSRGVRRKINLNNPKPWIGLMDLTGEHDYMILVKRK